jgi:hypothetical protein
MDAEATKSANSTELDMLGYAREEFVGHHIVEFHADGSSRP